MQPKKVKQTLRAAFRADLPIMLWGSPGIGKSAVVEQEAGNYAASLHEKDGEAFARFKVSQFDDASEFINAVSLIIFDPVELKGIPTIEDGRTVYTRSELVPGAKSRVCVLFLDEIVNAPRSVQASAYQLVLDRRLGSHALPSHVRIVAAGNLSADGAPTRAMPTPLVSRFMHVRFDLSVDNWSDYAQRAGFHPAVIAFAGKWRTELLYTFDQERAERGEYEDGETYACPRTWQMVSDALYAGIPKPIELEFISGIVGQAVGAEFVSFMRVWRSLPDLDLALSQPDVTPVPDRVSACFAASVALARRIDRTNLDAAIRYMERIKDDAGNTRRDFVELMIREAIKVNPDIQNCEAFGRFAVDYSTVLS